MSDKILKHLRLRPPLNDEAYEVVVSHLTMFRRAGGWITWDLWRGLKAQTRSALIESCEAVRAEEAAAIGLATQGPKQAAQVLSAADGGDLVAELILDEFAEKMGKK